jgi:hypothetical protein
MHGSGLYILNPPWTLQSTLQEVMPYLVGVLGQDAGAGFTLAGQGVLTGAWQRVKPSDRSGLAVSAAHFCGSNRNRVPPGI